ncbi:LamG domain-containing protein [Candidatus Poribacteria bacterium]
MGNFILTLTAPKEYGLEEFDTDASIWSATDVSKASASRYTSDPMRNSVMRIQSVLWTLGDGKTLGDALLLNDSIVGKGEGVYKDFTVTAGVRYSFSCLYKVGDGTLTVQLYDQTNDALISSVDKTNAVWSSHETSAIIPVGCTTLRVGFLQSQADDRSGPFYIDNVSLSGNVLLHDPDSYSRVPERVGSLHQTLGGRRVYDLRAIHYSFYLGWNFFREDQYENLREIYYSNELLYFSDGNVPALVESEAVYKTAQYDYENIVNPSSTHKAYFDSSSSLPSAKSDFETTEFTASDYQAIDGDDSSYKETSNPSADEYLYHKFLLSSSIDSADAKRFRVRIAMSGSDSSPQDLDGGVLYAWNGTNWVELTRSTNGAQTDLTYSTAETEVAKQFVDSSDDYIRLLLRSRGRRDGTNALNLRTYYLECEINEGLNLTIELSHKAIVDGNDDVIWVKNLTQGTHLQQPIEYTIPNDRRSVIVGAVYATLDGGSQYFSGGDVLNSGTGDFSISGWVKMNGNPSSSAVFAQKYGSGVGYSVYINTNGRLTGYIQDSGGTVYSADGAPITDNQWHHIAVAFDRDGNMTRYVDGSPYGVPNDISSISGDISNGTNLAIGANSTGTLFFFGGSIRDVRIWVGGTWSASEISTQAANPLDNSVGGVNTSSWYFTDTASATLINDDTGSNNLTLASGDTTNYGKHSRTELTAAGDEIEVKYNRYFEVMFASIPEEWFSGDPSSEDISRSAEVVLQTLSESR